MLCPLSFLNFRRSFLLSVHLYVTSWLCLLFIGSSIFVSGQELVCCTRATGSCRSTCEKIPLVTIAVDSALRNKTLVDFHKFCSPQLASFWDCINGTYAEIAKGESWAGRACCPLPQSETCRRTCVTATTRDELSLGCRQSDELAFFTCLDRQDAGETCCGHAVTDACRHSCSSIFRSHLTPTRDRRDQVLLHCEDSPKVLQCVKNFTKVTPATNSHKQLHCCERSSDIICREGCKKILRTKTTLEEIFDNLQENGCGPPMFQDKFWQCFIRSTDTSSTSVEVSRIDRLGMDSAKLHCCQRAASAHCRKLCTKTFSKDWTTMWDEFNRHCLGHVSEENLRTCLDEVEEPCELGCDGLGFCTNFNNRPTELFRACTSDADDAAKFDVALWHEQGYLSLPGLKLPVRNISRCSPNTWKAVACTLQIKPCSRHSHANQICRDVCLEILSQCMDWSRMPAEHTALSLCAKLSPENKDTPCISLKSFLKPSDNPYQKMDEQVSSPCKGDPCGPDEICTVNRNCLAGTTCPPYTCSSGCKLGEVSQYLVPEASYVRIPSNNGHGCLKICRCHGASIEQCQPLPCFPMDSCYMADRRIEHGASFYMECNICSCFAGEFICTKKQCESSAMGHAFTTLPCNCPPHYVPVCGKNGNTYPSSCLAKCAGLNDADIEYGVCQNPCRGNPCPIGQKCVPDSKICLSMMHRPCSQYQCINGTTDCKSLGHEPVCDVEGREHDNACFLAHHNKKLAYRGACLRNCKSQDMVCAVNGKTYVSECSALADYVSVDYEGPCVAVGLITDKKSEQCTAVQCPTLADDNCIGVTPPGACCPVCAGAIRLLYSTKQIDRALYALRSISTTDLTLRATLRALERQIQVAQCALRGYLTVELDIFIMVQSIEKPSSALQLEACVREAEKLASLVRNQSPRVASELSLSALTVATVVHTQAGPNAAPPLLTASTSCLLVIVVSACFVVRWTTMT